MSGSIEGSIDSGLLIPSESAATVQLISSDANLRSEWYALLRAMGYAVIQHAAPQQNGEKSASKRVDLILLLSAGDEAATVELIRQTAQGDQAPPVVVFGAVAGMKWPKRALEAGAFGYLPLDAKVEQQAGLLAVAVRFREMQVKVQLLSMKANVFVPIWWGRTARPPRS